MPNLFGGNKHKRYKKRPTVDKKEEVPYKENNNIYAQVRRRLGGKRVEVMCDDGVLRHAIIPGAMYKKVWLNDGNIVLVQLDEMLKGDCNIVYKYNDTQIKKLKSSGALNSIMNITEENNIVFGEDEEENVSNDEDDIFDKVDEEVAKDTANTFNKTNLVSILSNKTSKSKKKNKDRISFEDI